MTPVKWLSIQMLSLTVTAHQISIFQTNRQVLGFSLKGRLSKYYLKAVYIFSQEKSHVLLMITYPSNHLFYENIT